MLRLLCPITFHVGSASSLKELSYIPEETSAETSYSVVEQLREQSGRNRCPGEREELLILPSFMALSTLQVY